MKTFSIILCCFFFSFQLYSQKITAGWSFQSLWVADNDFFENNPNDRATYHIYSPLRFSIRLYPLENFYWNNSFAINNEQLVRYNNYDQSSQMFSTGPTQKYEWKMVEASTLFGYAHKIGKFDLSIDVGSRLTKIYSFMTVFDRSWGLYDRQTSVLFDSIKDVQLTGEMGLSLGYYFTKKLKIQVRSFGLRRIFTTNHSDYKLRIYNYHPSHEQNHLFGIETGLFFTIAS